MGNVCTGPKSTTKAVVGGEKDKHGSSISAPGGGNSIRRSYQSGVRDAGEFVNGSNTTINSKSAGIFSTDEATTTVRSKPQQERNISSAAAGDDMTPNAENNGISRTSELSPIAQNQNSISDRPRPLPSPTERQQSSTSAKSVQTAATTSLSTTTSHAATTSNDKSKASTDGAESLIAPSTTTESNTSEPRTGPMPESHPQTQRTSAVSPPSPDAPVVGKNKVSQSLTSSTVQNGSTSICNGHSNGIEGATANISMSVFNRVTPSVVDEYWKQPKMKQFTMMYVAQQTADLELVKLREGLAFISEEDESVDDDLSEADVIDRDEAGFMTLDIFQKALLSVSSDISSALSADFTTWSSNIFDKLDCTKEGSIHFVEFMAIFLYEKVTKRKTSNGSEKITERKQLDQGELKQVFNNFDKDQAGTLSKGNLRQTLAMDWDLEYVDVLDIYALVDEMFDQMPLEHEECITFSDFSLLFKEHQ